MILDVVRGYKVSFILLPRQSRVPNLCCLIKKETDPVDQEVQDMFRKVAYTVLNLKEDQFLI